MVDAFLQLNNQGYPFLFLLVVISILLKRYKPVSLQVLEIMNVLMAIGGILTLLGLMEWVKAFYSGVQYESFAIENRLFGPYWFAYWFNFVGVATLTQLFWLKRLRRSVLFSLFILVLPLLAKALSLLTTLHRDYLPSSWAMTYRIMSQMEYVFLYVVLVLIKYLIVGRIKSLTAKA